MTVSSQRKYGVGDTFFFPEDISYSQTWTRRTRILQKKTIVPGTKEETYDFDELLTKKVGDFGRKQRFLSMLLTSSATCTCLQSLSSVFIAG